MSKRYTIKRNVLGGAVVCFIFLNWMTPPSPIENIKIGKPEEKSFTFQPRILLNIHHLVKFQSRVGYFCKSSQYVFTKWSTGESNVRICSPSSLLSAEQMRNIGAHASGGCSPPSATILSALPLTSSLGLDSGAGCCTVWTLTRGAGKHVTLSWLDTSEKHWCWKIYALAWILTFYSVVYIVPVWSRRNTFTRILRFSWASRSRSTSGNPPSSEKFVFWMKHTIPFMYLFLMSQQIVHTEMGIYKSAGRKTGWEDNTLRLPRLHTR